MNLLSTIIVLLICSTAATNDPSNKKALAQVIRINDSTAAQLDPLPRVIHPRKINIQRSLDDTEYDANRIECVFCRAADNPVEDVERPVAAQGDKVVAVDYSRHGDLAVTSLHAAMVQLHRRLFFKCQVNMFVPGCTLMEA